MSADSNGRTWCWLDDVDDIVVPEQPQIAVYSNPAGAVVLRQPAAVHDEDDDVIFFAPQHARAIATAILELAGLDAAALAPEPEPAPAQIATKPRDATAAERQRRRRARQKEEPTLDVDRDEARDVTAETVTGDG